MQLSISTRHGHLSEPTQEKLRGKAEKLGRFFERLTAIEIIVDLKDSAKPHVDVKVSAEHKHDFVAGEQAESLLSAMEACVQKIEQQLRKYKERVQDRRHGADGRRDDAPGDESPEALAADLDLDE